MRCGSRLWVVVLLLVALAGCERPLFIPVSPLEPPTDTCADIPSAREVEVAPLEGGQGWRVAWAPPELPGDEVPRDLTYAVEVSVDSAGFARLAAGVTDTAYLDGRVQPADRELTYRVVAEVAGCSAPPSGEVTVRTEPLPAENLAALAGPTGVELTWDDENRIGDSNVIVEVDVAGEELLPIACVSSSVGSCTLDLPPDSVHRARVVLERAPVVGSSEHPPFRVASEEIDVATRSLPVEITATLVDDDSIEVSFTSANESHASYGAVLLELPGQAAILPPTAASHTFAGLPMDTELTVVVLAYNRDGVPGPEASVVVRTTCRQEAFPTAIRAESGFLGTAPYIDVFFARTEAPLEPEGFVYELERCQGAGSACEGGPWVRVGTITELDLVESADGSLELRFRDALGLLLDERYAYRARPHRFGTGCPPPGQEVTASLEVRSPPETGSLTQLYWSAVPEPGFQTGWTNENGAETSSGLYRRRAGEAFAPIPGTEAFGSEGEYFDPGPFDLDAVYEYAVGYLNPFTTLRQPDGSDAANPVFTEATTVFGPPRPATSITVETIDDATLEVHWTHDNQYASSVRIRLLPTPNVFSAAVDNGSLTISGLAASTTYTAELVVLSQQSAATSEAVSAMGTTGTPPIVTWSAPPILDGPTCALQLPGTALPGDAPIASFSATISPVSVLGDLEADAAGVTGTLLLEEAPAPFSVTWRVEDEGGLLTQQTRSFRSRMEAAAVFLAGAGGILPGASELLEAGGTARQPLSLPEPAKAGTCDDLCLGRRAQMIASEQHACFLDREGRVRCFGRGGETTRLGHGLGGSDSSIPVFVCTATGAGCQQSARLEGVHHFALGVGHGCAVVGEEAAVHCWGDNAGKQLANPIIPFRDHSNVVCRTDYPANGICPNGDPLEGVRQIAAGERTVLVVDGDGALLCWGGRGDGFWQCGQDLTTLDSPTPVCAPGATDCNADPLVDVKKVVSAWNHACALHGPGPSLACWGLNQDGQLGVGTATAAEGVTGVSFASSALAGVEIVDVATGVHHTCVLTSEGRVGCWGRRDGGALGDGQVTGSDVLAPADYVCGPAGCGADLDEVVAVSAHESTCALRQDGTVWCWGRLFEADFGELVVGLPVQLCESGPAPAGGCTVDDPPLVLVTIDVGKGFACGVRPTGAAVCVAFDYGQASKLGGGMPLGVENSVTNHPDPVVDVCTALLPGTGVGESCTSPLLDAAVRGCGAVEVVEVMP